MMFIPVYSAIIATVLVRLR